MRSLHQGRWTRVGRESSGGRSGSGMSGGGAQVRAPLFRPRGGACRGGPSSRARRRSRSRSRSRARRQQFVYRMGRRGSRRRCPRARSSRSAGFAFAVSSYHGDDRPGSGPSAGKGALGSVELPDIIHVARRRGRGACCRPARGRGRPGGVEDLEVRGARRLRRVGSDVGVVVDHDTDRRLNRIRLLDGVVPLEADHLFAVRPRRRRTKLATPGTGAAVRSRGS